MKIEQWVYKINEHRGVTYVYTMTFEGDKLVKIAYEDKIEEPESED
jgi:hypothetical protein